MATSRAGFFKIYLHLSKRTAYNLTMKRNRTNYTLNVPSKKWGSKTVYFLLFLAAFLVFENTLTAQPINRFQRKTFIKKGDTLPYRIMLPKGYMPNNEYPLIIFLHGSGERGKDNELQLTHGAQLFVQDSIMDNYPAIVVFPQCSEDQSWHNARYQATKIGGFYDYPTGIYKNRPQELLTGLLKHLRRNYSLDDKRLYVGGLSMGGLGAYEMVRRNPRTFAAAFVICGGANPKVAGELTNTSWWLYHGRADNVIPPLDSKKMYDALKRKKADVKLSLYPDVGHDSWTKVFSDPRLMPWLFSKSR